MSKRLSFANSFRKAAASSLFGSARQMRRRSGRKDGRSGVPGSLFSNWVAVRCSTIISSIRTTVSRLLASVRRAERVVQSLHDSQDFRSDNRVIDSRSLAPRLDQPVRSQPHKLLRHRHLFDCQSLSQFGDRSFTIDQRAQNEQPLGVRQTAHQFGGLFGGRYHFLYIHTLEFKTFEC